MKGVFTYFPLMFPYLSISYNLYEASLIVCTFVCQSMSNLDKSNVAKIDNLFESPSWGLYLKVVNQDSCLNTTSTVVL